jgi:hypothetical protein
MQRKSRQNSKLGFSIPRNYRHRFKTGSQHGKKVQAGEVGVQNWVSAWQESMVQVQIWVSTWQESIGPGSKLGLDMLKRSLQGHLVLIHQKIILLASGLNPLKKIWSIFIPLL